jgi:sugar lactone lactonase YvrE
MIRRIVWALLALLLMLSAYLTLWPVPVRAVAWDAPPVPGYTGAHASNDRLAGPTLISLGAESGPEHVVLARDGRLYAAMASGNIVRMNPDGSGQEVLVHTGGSVLGFDFDAAGRLLDIIEQACTGRILEHDPATQRTLVVAKGLCFANGVALSRDEQSLFVAETGKYRVWKLDIAANDLDVREERAPAQARILFDNLPGYPDNLMRGLDGRIWLAFSGPRSPDVDAMADKPFLRELTLPLPRALWPLPKRYGHAMAFTEDGTIVADLQDPSGAYPQTTGVTETAGRLYIQNLHLDVLGWMKTPGP